MLATEGMEEFQKNLSPTYLKNYFKYTVEDDETFSANIINNLLSFEINPENGLSFIYETNI